MLHEKAAIPQQKAGIDKIYYIKKAALQHAAFLTIIPL